MGYSDFSSAHINVLSLRHKCLINGSDNRRSKYLKEGEISSHEREGLQALMSTIQ